jgi:isovaleryl-CoA dehydrogenase
MQRWLPALLRRAAPAVSGGGGGEARLFASSSLLFDDTQVQVRHALAPSLALFPFHRHCASPVA